MRVVGDAVRAWRRSWLMSGFQLHLPCFPWR